MKSVLPLLICIVFVDVFVDIGNCVTVDLCQVSVDIPLRPYQVSNVTTLKTGVSGVARARMA